MAVNHEEALRVVFLNMRGFSTCPWDTGPEGRRKDLAVKDFILEHKVDAVLMAETDIHWDSVLPFHRPVPRTEGWFDGRRMENAFHKDFEADGG
jgi:hypothetical protein